MAGEMVCELCGKSGVLSHMSIFQLNFGEAVLLCENPECVFPLLGGRLENYIIQRKASEMSNIKRKKKKKQPSLKQKLDAVWIPGRQEPCASSKEGASTCSLKSTSSLPKAPSPYSGNKFLEVCDSLSDVPMETEHCSFEEYIQWCNSSALCWLDCVLSLLVFNKSIKTLTSKISSSGSRLATLQETYTKALDIMHMDQNKANNLLSDVRQSLWDYLKPKMKCKLGVNDSPVFALPLILRENSVTSQTCLQEYTWQFHCNECGFSEAIRRKKHVVTVPNTPDDFTLPEATFVKTCPKCGSHSQKSNLVYDKAPSVLFLHLVEGLRSEGYHDNEFNILDQRYRVTQFIQYKHNPDHFVCWTKQNNGSKWMELDDLKSSVCTWSHDIPTVPPSQVHILVCEPLEKDTLQAFVEPSMEVVSEVEVEVSEDDDSLADTNSLPKKDTQVLSMDYSKDTQQELLMPSKIPFVPPRCGSVVDTQPNSTLFGKNSVLEPHVNRTLPLSNQPCTVLKTHINRTSPILVQHDKKANSAAEVVDSTVLDELSSSATKPVSNLSLSTTPKNDSETQNKHSLKIPLEAMVTTEQMDSPKIPLTMKVASQQMDSPKTPLTMKVTNEIVTKRSTMVSQLSKKHRLSKNHFEPYVPKKQRLSSTKGDVSQADAPGAKGVWQAITEHKALQGVIIDDGQSDSGYSSPSSVGSVGSCSSLGPQLTIENRNRLHPLDSVLESINELKTGDIVAEIEALLDDNILCQRSPSPLGQKLGLRPANDNEDYLLSLVQ